MQSYCGICNICIHTWHLFSPDFSWDDAVVVTISDASFCQEQGVTQNFKSQQACITALALGNALNAEKMLAHSPVELEFDENQKSPSQAEGYALSNAVEHGLRARATIVDMRGQLNVRQWEEKASAAMGHVWFADCESLFAHLIFSQRSTCGTIVTIVMKKSVGRRVIILVGSTSAMLSDCLTKAMTSGWLNETLSTGTFDMRPTEESLVIKTKNRKWRVKRAGNGRRIPILELLTLVMLG